MTELVQEVLQSVRYSPLPRYLILEKIGGVFETHTELDRLLERLKAAGHVVEDDGRREIELTTCGRVELVRLEEARRAELGR